jgi:hypothetical protein
MLLLAAACAVLAGCGAGDRTAPDDITASWDSLDYLSADGQATVQIGGDGVIHISDASLGDHDGLLGPATWRALENALTLAGLEPCTPPAGSGEGAVVLVRDSETLGFRWSAPGELSAAQSEVVDLFEQMRSEAENPDVNPRLVGVPVAKLLHGFDAAGPAEAILVRDEDQLIDLLRGRLDRESVVLPRIDFGREMVLAVFLGPRGNEAFDVIIDGYAAPTLDGFMKVAVDRFARVSGNCPAVGDGIHGAFDLVRLPRSDAQVFLDWGLVRLECVEP